MDFTGIIIFLLGLLSGGLIIWFVRQKGMESLDKTKEEMKQEFENISNKVLLENQNQLCYLEERDADLKLQGHLQPILNIYFLMNL